jgi:hypothetical protein
MSLIAHFPLNASLIDLTKSSTVTSTGDNTSVSTGKIGYANNKTSGAYITNITLIPESFSIGMWARHNGTNWVTSDCLFGTRVGNDGFMLYRNSGDVANYYRAYFWYVNTANTVVGYNTWPGISNVPSDAWFHVAMSRHSDGRLELYLNGVNVYSGTPPSDFKSWHNNGVQLAFHGQGNGSGYTDGNYSFNDIRLYDHAISIKEVKDLFKAKILQYTFNQLQEPTTNVASVTLFPYTPYNTLVRTGQNLTFTMVGGSALYLTVHNGTDYNGNIITHSGYMYRNGNPHTLPYDRANTYHTVPAIKFYFDPVSGYFEIVENCNAASIWLFHTPSGANGGDIIQINDYQVEIKEYATPIVVGSRTGMVNDASGFGNMATLSESSTPQWISDGRLGNGAYKFDGVSGTKIDITSSYGVFDYYTISFWVNRSAASRMSISSKVNTNFYWYGDNSWRYTHSSGAGEYYYPKSVSIPDGVWGHYCVTYDGGAVRVYRNGVFEGQQATTGSANFTNGFMLGDWVGGVGYTFNGSIDDVRIYSSTLSDTEVLALTNTRGQLDNDGNLSINSITTNGYAPTLMDYTTWVLGSQGGQTGFGQNGLTSENQIIARDNPYLENDIVWATLTNDATSDADGGWNSTSFAIDRTKKYRTSVWIRRENVGDGRTYFGCQGNQVWNLGTVTVNGNPYFTSWLIGSVPAANYGWVLLIAYIHPTAYAGGNDPTNGVYSVDGTRVLGSTDYKWTDTATQSQQRTYLFYSTSVAERQYYYRPRFEVVDGNEPTITELLSCSEHRPLINASNIYDYKTYNIGNDGVGKYGNVSELGITDGLVGFWKLNGDAKDYSGNGYDGIITGAVPASGLKDSSYYFNYTTDKIRCGLAPGINTNFSISAWVNSNNVANPQNIVSRNAPFFMRINQSKVRFNVFSGGSWLFQVGTTILTNNTWYHFTMAYDGFNWVGYINGNQEFNVSKVGTITQGPTYMDIGYTTGGEDAPMDGEIAEIRFYNRTISADENLINYKFGLPATGMQLAKDGTLYLNGEINEV